MKQIEHLLGEDRKRLRQSVTSWKKIDLTKAVPITRLPLSFDWHEHQILPGAQMRVISRAPDMKIVAVECRWSMSAWTKEHCHPGYVKEIVVTRGHIKVFAGEEIEVSPRSTPCILAEGEPHAIFAFRGAECVILFHPPMDSSASDAS